MNPVSRSEILDFATYGDTRPATKLEMQTVKGPRRVHLGEHLTFLFENHETIRHQVQEMVFIERLVREADIQHEIDTYNEILGGAGELGCTLLIEIESAEERAVLLKQWLGLPEHCYLVLPDGSRVRASHDARQIGEDRVSSVQFMKFDTRGAIPVSIGCDHPHLSIEAELPAAAREALEQDLAVDRTP